MELTREDDWFTRDELQSLIENGSGRDFSFGYVKSMAKQLLAEMDKPGVWDKAPEWATKATVNWSAPTHYSGVYKEYTRILPKSRSREIAEDSAIKLDQLEARIDTHLCNFNKDDFASIIEQAILKYAEENK